MFLESKKKKFMLVSLIVFLACELEYIPHIPTVMLCNEVIEIVSAQFCPDNANNLTNLCRWGHP